MINNNTLKELKEYHKIHHSTKQGDHKIRCGSKDFSVVLRVDEKRAIARVWDHTASVKDRQT